MLHIKRDYFEQWFMQSTCSRAEYVAFELRYWYMAFCLLLSYFKAKKINDDTQHRSTLTDGCFPQLHKWLHHQEGGRISSSFSSIFKASKHIRFGFLSSDMSPYTSSGVYRGRIMFFRPYSSMKTYTSRPLKRAAAAPSTTSIFSPAVSKNKHTSHQRKSHLWRRPVL